jgi:hypothetical protein
MITREQARRAQAVLGARLGCPPWLRGIGIMADGHGSCFLKVNVQALTEEVRTALPDEINGVPIRVEAVGTLRAF